MTMYRNNQFTHCFVMLLLCIVYSVGLIDSVYAQSSKDMVQSGQQVLPELRDLDLTGWEGLNNPSGIAKYPDLAARNRMKNRAWVNVDTLPKGAIRRCTFDEFVALADSINRAIGLTADGRKTLTPEQTKELDKAHAQFVSVEGWLVLAYPGGKESTNSYSAEYHDWHLELSKEPSDHYPRPGDPTPIIAEVTPFVERSLYRMGIRIQPLAGFLRQGEPPNIVVFPMPHKPRKIRVTGQLLLDDSHIQPGKDVGTTIQTAVKGGYHNPWRRVGWEIHPIVKIEDLGE